MALEVGASPGAGGIRLPIPLQTLCSASRIPSWGPSQPFLPLCRRSQAEMEGVCLRRKRCAVPDRGLGSVLGVFFGKAVFQVPRTMLVFGPRVVGRSISLFWGRGGFISRSTSLEGSQGFLLSAGAGQRAAGVRGVRGGGVSPKPFQFAPKKKPVAPSSHPWQRSASSMASASLGPSRQGPAPASHQEPRGGHKVPPHAPAPVLPPTKALPFPSPVRAAPHGLGLPMVLLHLAAQISSPPPSPHPSQKRVPPSSCIPSWGKRDQPPVVQIIPESTALIYTWGPDPPAQLYVMRDKFLICIFPPAGWGDTLKAGL